MADRAWQPFWLLPTVVAMALLATPARCVCAEEAPAEPGWLGFGYTFHDATGEGVEETFLFVQGVLAESPAEKVGLKKGDRVLEIDDQPVARFTEAAILDFFLDVRAGQRVKLQVEREAVPRDLELQAVAVPPEHQKAREVLLRLRAAGTRTPPS